MLISERPPAVGLVTSKQAQLLKTAVRVVESATKHTTKPRAATTPPQVRYILTDTMFLELQRAVKEASK